MHVESKDSIHIEQDYAMDYMCILLASRRAVKLSIMDIAPHHQNVINRTEVSKPERRV